MKPTNPNTPPSTCAEPKLAKTSPHVRTEVRLQVPAVSAEAQLNKHLNKFASVCVCVCRKTPLSRTRHLEDQ